MILHHTGSLYCTDTNMNRGPEDWTIMTCYTKFIEKRNCNIVNLKNFQTTRT